MPKLALIVLIAVACVAALLNNVVMLFVAVPRFAFVVTSKLPTFAFNVLSAELILLIAIA